MKQRIRKVLMWICDGVLAADKPDLQWMTDVRIALFQTMLAAHRDFLLNQVEPTRPAKSNYIN